MSFVTDPDNLDRFEVAVDPTNERISLRGQGAIRTAKRTDGDVTGASAYQALGATFITNGVTAGDILTIVSGTNIGHYTVATIPTETTLTINETFPDAAEAAGQTFRINQTISPGQAAEDLVDGVTLQALYSFLKEEWRTLSDADMPDLIKFTFPLESITREQFEIGGTQHSGWDWKDDTTRNLIRTGGWQKQDNAGNVIQDYAGVVTLGALDADAQAYYEQHAEGIDPINFVLTGAVNQAINTFDEVTGPDAGVGFAITTNNTIARNDGGNWFTDGYRAGGRITIRAAEDVGNNGTFTIASVQNSVDGNLVVVGTPLTNNAADTTMIAAVNKRAFLRLFVRKKGKTYPGVVDLAAIGVTSIETIVNRFPMTHTDDPAIVLDDGQMAGDPANTPFRQVETHSTGVNGVTETAPTAAADAFTFTSAAVSPAFNDGVLQVGDSVEITSGSDQGFFEIKSIDSATQVTLFKEPTATYTGGGSTLTFTARTGTLDSGAADGALADVDGATGTLTSATSTFATDGGLGDRIVNAGDMVILTSGIAAHLGIYKVISRDSATQLTLNTADQPFTTQTAQTFIVVRPRMALQRFETLATTVGPVITPNGFDFNNANPDTIDRNDAGNWSTDGYVAGMAVRVATAELPANDKPAAGSTNLDDGYIIDAGGVTAGTLTLLAEETLTASLDDNTAVISGEVGIVRIPNATSGEPFPFHWRLFGNGGTLSQCFQFVQRQLRRETDIDLATATARGDVSDLLMSFASPNGVTFDMYIDDLASADRNNITFGDLTGDSRGFPFIAGVTVNLNDNLTNDSSAKVVIFFDDADGTPANGDEFGTVGAIIVQDDTAANMEDTTPLANPLQFNFDYDNNAQGGRTPGTDADIVIVGIGLETAQYVQLRNPGTVKITRQNNNVFSLTAPLERNYSNP